MHFTTEKLEKNKQSKTLTTQRLYTSSGLAILLHILEDGTFHYAKTVKKTHILGPQQAKMCYI